MDQGTVTSLHVYPQEEASDSNLQVQKQLETFILEFRLDNIFVYRSVCSLKSELDTNLLSLCRDQLRENTLLQKYFCDVNIGDLIKYNEELAHRLVTEPAVIIPLVRESKT